MPEGYNLVAQVSHHVHPVVVSAPPVVHTIPVVNDKIYHVAAAPSESLGFYDRMDDFQDQFNEMQRER